jgi:tRNA A-37 threonylcarbamoyl transferase component Bud32
MGRVVLAKDRQFGRTVALKEVLRRSPALEARFMYETVVTANLEHPGVPPVYERGRTADGLPFYTMRVVDGRTLSVAIQEARTLEDRLKLLPHVIRVAQTLAYAHDRGVVHRDVKPDNVLVGRHGETVVLDWGIAKVRGTGDDGALEADLDDLADGLTRVGLDKLRTRVGSVLGTPAYMAPEQASGRVDRIDERTDVFALGGLLYHLLSGRAPFEGLTMESLVIQALEAKCTPLAEVAPGSPAALVAICEKAMSKEADNRFPTATAMAEALESALTGALAAPESPFARYLAAAGSVAALLVALVGAFAAAMSSSSFKEQGMSAWFLLFLTVLGAGLTTLEWLTRGRLKLLPLTATLAVGTFMSGLGGTFGALGVAGKYGSTVEPEKMLSTALQGLWEASGNATFGTNSALVQAILIALVWRSLLLRKEAARGASTHRDTVQTS